VIKKFSINFSFFFLILIGYFFFTIFSYTASSIFLIKGYVIDISIIRDYQRNFYHQLGFRKIWQHDKNCIVFDYLLIFKPNLGNCKFTNTEFNTELNFSSNGRLNGNTKINLKTNKSGIAVLGDSHAMGWGVNDNETFSALLEEKLERPVYNLAVSGYATNREILALKKSNLIDKIDTIIIQYCNNDFDENLNFKNINSENSLTKFEKITNEKLSSFDRFRKGIRYALTIPLKSKNKILDWKKEEDAFIEILNNYEFLFNKKIIVFYANGQEINYKNFYLEKKNKIKDLSLINVYYDKNDYYLIDGHLNKNGHIKIANILYEILK
jgi:lysophospholipase L1-like esterase